MALYADGDSSNGPASDRPGIGSRISYTKDFEAVSMRFALSWHRIVRRIGVSAVVLLVFLEISIRAVTNTLFVFDVEVRDPLVGGIPKPGVSIRHPTKWYRMTAVENGTRWNGSGSIAGEAAFALAVGDSFTFGADVSDEETWPAALERETGRRVVNAGVAGFGLDQTVLRAEQLVECTGPNSSSCRSSPTISAGRNGHGRWDRSRIL